MTQKNIQDLIDLPKKIDEKEPKKGYKIENHYRRCNLRLTDDKSRNMKFNIFIRQNQEFIENFSIGLLYKSSELKCSIMLVRYNGPHGPKRNETDHHPKPHIHFITENEIQLGNLKPSVKNIEITNKYNTFEEALRVFLEDVKVINWKNYFSNLDQRSLFNEY